MNLKRPLNNATSFQALSHDGKYDTPVELLARQGHIKEAITSYKLSRFADGKYAAPYYRHTP